MLTQRSRGHVVLATVLLAVCLSAAVACDGAGGSTASRSGNSTGGRPASSLPPLISSRPVTAPQSGAPPGSGDSTPSTITLVGTGDVLLHPPLWNQARRDAGRATNRAHPAGYDFRPLFAAVKKTVSAADVAICHLETPLAPPAGPFTGYPSFSVPPHVAAALADTGYDSCSTASNHTLDAGPAGVYRTLDALDQAGIKHAGSYRSRAEHDAVTFIDVRGVRVAHLSYTYGFNGLTRPAGKPWIANQIDRTTILNEATRARAAGAAIVVVSLHFGTEYRHEPDSAQVSLTHALIGSPNIDLILGSHTHAVQAFEKINGKWVVYGMGNEVAYHASPINDNREGVLARITFAKDGDGSWRARGAQAQPLWMTLTPEARLADIAQALADPATSTPQRAILRAAWRRIVGYLDSRAAIRAGLVVGAG